MATSSPARAVVRVGLVKVGIFKVRTPPPFFPWAGHVQLTAACAGAPPTSLSPPVPNQVQSQLSAFVPLPSCQGSVHLGLLLREPAAHPSFSRSALSRSPPRGLLLSLSLSFWRRRRGVFLKQQRSASPHLSLQPLLLSFFLPLALQFFPPLLSRSQCW